MNIYGNIILKKVELEMLLNRSHLLNAIRTKYLRWVLRFK